MSSKGSHLERRKQQVKFVSLSKMENISERIAYLPAGVNPLSSDVGFVHGDKCEWIFDVGCSDVAARQINGINREKRIVLSHFHHDHIGNIDRVTGGGLYCGSNTYSKIGRGQVLTGTVTFDDGCKIKLFPIPCSHAKGSIGLEVDGEYAFLGDAVYCMVKAGRGCYNVSLLNDTIRTLESLRADKFLVSHTKPFVKSRDDVIGELKSLYSRRKAGEAYIYLRSGGES